METFYIIVSSLSALLLLMVGVTRLSNPKSAYAKNTGIELPDDVNLMNEVRGTSAMMLCGGILVALGIVLPEMKFASFVVGSLIFMGFAMGRMLSMNVDGKPHKLLVQGLGFELVLGGLNLFCLLQAFL
ncbi:MAG: DUF4345 domain-containing protein [Bacteroidota bacterium]